MGGACGRYQEEVRAGGQIYSKDTTLKIQAQVGGPMEKGTKK